MNDDLISRKTVLGLTRDICVPTKDGEYRHRCVDPQDVMELPSIKMLSAEEVAKSMSYGTVYTYLNWFEVIKQIYDLGFAIIEKRKIDNGKNIDTKIRA